MGQQLAEDVGGIRSMSESLMAGWLAGLGRSRGHLHTTSIELRVRAAGARGHNQPSFLFALGGPRRSSALAAWPVDVSMWSDVGCRMIG